MENKKINFYMFGDSKLEAFSISYSTLFLEKKFIHVFSGLVILIKVKAGDDFHNSEYNVCTVCINTKAHGLNVFYRTLFEKVEVNCMIFYSVFYPDDSDLSRYQRSRYL